VEVEPAGFDSVGGFLLARLGRVPASGERVGVDGLSVGVSEAERRRVNRIRVGRLPDAEAPAGVE